MNIKYAIVVTMMILITFNKGNSQSVYLSGEIQYMKFKIQQTSSINYNNYNNGIGGGVGIAYYPKKTILSLASGISLHRFWSDYFNISLINIPLTVDFNFGERIGFFVGGGICFDLLLNEPDDQNSNNNYKSVILSSILHAGVFFKHKNVKFQISPELIYGITPFFYNYTYHVSGGKNTNNYFLPSFGIKLIFAREI